MTGVTERDPAHPGTLYNTLLFHGPDGELALKHRKLVPTNHERLVWGPGDGGGLEAVETPYGRLGGLVCWENYMPLARFALYESGIELYVASTADDSEEWQSTLVHLARESRCFVIAPSHFQRAASYPDDFPLAPDARRRGRDRPRRLRDPRPGRLVPGRPALGRGGRALRRARPRAAGRANGSASTRPATTTARTSSASTSPGRDNPMATILCVLYDDPVTATRRSTRATRSRRSRAITAARPRRRPRRSTSRPASCSGASPASSGCGASSRSAVTPHRHVRQGRARLDLRARASRGGDRDLAAVLAGVPDRRADREGARA